MVDGRVLGTLEADDRVRIVRSDARFQMVEVRGQSYYRTLRDKLGWGGQIRKTVAEATPAACSTAARHSACDLVARKQLS